MFKALKEKLGFIKKKAESMDQEFTTGVGKKITEDKLEDFLWDIEVALMEADVAVDVIEKIKNDLKKALVGKKVKLRADMGKIVEDTLKKSIKDILSKDFDFDEFIRNAPRPTVIMFLGVNGTGKTTVIAKLAKYLKDKGYSVVMAAGDTFRAGAIEQISIHGDNLGIKVIKHQAGGDPAAVCYDAIEHAKAKHRDFVLIDTAGRMQTNRNLMEEMKKIKRVAKPHLTIFVGDALAGNDAIEQAKKFEEAVGIDAVILNKVDADAKGGAALSIAYELNKPIIFLGNGQKYDDLMKFDVNWFLHRIFGD
ncbi:signal recognition particle-docking protein FtsY [Aciduliprofundum boonei T469]|nr:signal recognition particle-docking protein FtsY [Aciduliprofundum boonei T469]